MSGPNPPSGTLAATFPPLSALDAEEARLLNAGARLVSIPVGTVLFRDGMPCEAYVLVRSGAVRVQKVGASGREIVLYRVEAGQACLLSTTCLLAGVDYAAEAVAETDVEAVLVPAATFHALVARSESFRAFVFSTYANRLADLMLLIEEVAFGRIDMRLAGWLATHARDGAIQATHQDIAVELGTAREVVSRQLKDFERRGWVRLHRGRIVLDAPAALAALARE